MAHDDPVTIDLFGNTALSSGLGLGVTAFAGEFEADSGDDVFRHGRLTPL